MTARPLAALVEQARQAVGSSGTVIGAGAPRFELFHAANSVCSQKVRAVLAHHGVAYVSHAMRLFDGQTYLLEYVRLRLVGCATRGGPLVAHHSGSTSASQGCDALVVPTLVDNHASKVIVDSKAICLYLDALAPEPERLRPPALAAEIDRHLDLVDNVPNYQLLMGRQADVQGGAAAFSTRKVGWCDAAIVRHADEPELIAAYAAKRAKEQSAADGLFTPAAMDTARTRTEAALGALEGQLAAHPGAWLLAEAPTLADLFWGAELLRLDNLGQSAMWAGSETPGIAAYLSRLRTLPALRSSIIDWPGSLY